eukprot:g10612.t1
MLDVCGGCTVEGYEVDLLTCNVIRVQPIGEDSEFMIRKLAEEKNSQWKVKQWFVMRGKRGMRYFNFKPKEEGWRAGLKLCNMWAKRTDLLLLVLSGMVESEMQFPPKTESLEDIAKWMAEQIKPFADAVAGLKLGRTRSRVVDKMQRLPVEMLQGLVDARQVAKNWSFPSGHLFDPPAQ